MAPERTLRTRSTRLTRSNNSPPARATATIQHSSANTAHPSIRLTVKAPPSKLRQTISGSDLPPNPYKDDVDSETPDPPPRHSRATRNPRTVVEPDSDEDEDMDDEEEEDADGDEIEDDMEDDDDEEEEDDDEDAAGEELDDAEDEHPPPPIIATIPSNSKTKGKQKANIAVSAPPRSGPLKSVEDKEMDDDDELSELDEEEEEEPEEEEEEDAEGEEDDDSELDDEEGATRDGTPDLSKLTRRQRAAYDDSRDSEGALMALSNEAQKKKHLTAEEISMRRAEMARRRKNLSEKRNEEEKMDTINKLLKKPAPKRRTRAEIIAAQNAADNTPYSEEDGVEMPRPSALFVRYVQNKNGARIGVPEEWLDKDQPIGDALRPGWKGPRVPKMIEEVA